MRWRNEQVIHERDVETNKQNMKEIKRRTSRTRKRWKDEHENREKMK